MPVVKKGSRQDIARSVMVIAADATPDDGNIHCVTGEHPEHGVLSVPVYYRYLNMGSDWVVMVCLEGREVICQAAHRTELKLTSPYPNLRELLDGIESEFGAEYLPELIPYSDGLNSEQDNSADWFPKDKYNALTVAAEQFGIIPDQAPGHVLDPLTESLTDLKQNVSEA